MPVMDGVHLLLETQQRHPSVLRVLLSGTADEVVSLQATGAAHQFLAKPCDSDVLISTLSRLGNFNDLLNDSRIKQVAASMKTIPSMPTLYGELCDALKSPEAKVEQIASIISKDMGMMAKILQLVNSAFFGLSRNISDASQAVSYLGFDTVKTMVLTTGLFEQLQPGVVDGFSFERLWEHSLRTGARAQKIARALGLEEFLVADALAGGMLHDVGILLLATELPEEFEQSVRLSMEQHVLLSEAEHATYGISHAEVGAYILGLWGLRFPVVEAVAYHHTPRQAGSMEISPLLAVHVADAIERVDSSPCLGSMASHLDEQYIDLLGLSDRIAEWRK